MRGVVGAGEGDLVVLEEGGIELIPRDVFKPLDRAGIRLAREFEGSGPEGGRVT
jgi:hypothetical protein